MVKQSVEKGRRDDRVANNHRIPPVRERVVSDVTVTDPKHSLFGQRFTVLPERSGRGPAFVVVALPDGAVPFDPAFFHGSGASVAGG